MVKRKAPELEPKESRDSILDSNSPYAVLNSPSFFRKFKPNTRETKINAQGKLVPGKRVKGDSINLVMIYVAYANHANGETKDAWPAYSRIAAMAGVSTKNVQLGLHELCDRGLLKIDRRKSNRNGLGYTNVVRVVFDETLTKSDEASIASQTVISGLSRMSTSAQLSTGSRTSLNDTVDINPKNDAQDGHPGSPPFSRTSLNVHRTVELLNTTGHRLNGCNRDEVLKVWIDRAAHYELEEPKPNEADLQTASELEALHIPMLQAIKAIDRHLTDCVAFGSKPHARLKPIVQALVQNSNGR